jgi:hypothetical protein
MSSSNNDSNINFNNLIHAYEAMSSKVAGMTTSIGQQSSSGVQMTKLFQLQMAMNNLSMFGQSLTNVIQGIQDIAMSITRNVKGS